MTHEYDPRGLIEESYRINGILPQECRAIFLDWAMSCPEPPACRDQIAALLDVFGTGAPDHPMTAILRMGLAGAAHTGQRRGGAKARRGPADE